MAQMRRSCATAALRRVCPVVVASLVAGAAFAQSSPPLLPYVAAPSATPLAPLPGTVADDQAVGDVRASSATAANMSAADTRSNIAPALPVPDPGGDTAEGYLRAARAALDAGQSGAAQEALERAESRVLDRDVAPSRSGAAIVDPLIEAIGSARAALSVGDDRAALSAIAEALRS